jgi:hypothetical protein
LKTPPPSVVAPVIGRIPYRLALAGGWIDQPFVSRLNPEPPGSMVVVAIEPDFRAMDRSGLATGTRHVATRCWQGGLPRRDPATLVRELYAAENEGRPEPSGSQDMIGLVYPGINRLDYDFAVDGGVFPAHIERLQGARARWLERVLHVLPVAPRPEGYNPLEVKRLTPGGVARLGQTGRDCFEAIRRRDTRALGASFNACMAAWEELLPHTVAHPTLTVDLRGLLRAYQRRYPGAMYSGCGGGYLLVVSEQAVPGAFTIRVREESRTVKIPGNRR